jgi:hypothetical protein
MGYYIDRLSADEYQTVFPQEQSDLSQIHATVSDALEYFASSGVRWKSIELVGVSVICPECEGKGYIFGFCELKNSINIERCDTCLKFDSDESATKAAIVLLGGK